MPSDAVMEKARELLDQHRVLVLGQDPPGAIVMGGIPHQVWFDESGTYCDCMYGCDSAEPICSHAVAAMVAMEEFLTGG